MTARTRSYPRISAVIDEESVSSSLLALEHGSCSFDNDSEEADLLNEAAYPSEEHDENTAKKAHSRSRSQRAELYSTKLHALLWVVTALIAAHYLDFVHVICYDPRVRTAFFYVAVILSGIYACITCYLAIWLPYVKNIRLEWSVYCPRMIPTATLVGFSASFCFHCAFWPVYGVLTPAILSLFFIASLMTAHFLPSI
uniref:Transmembrane protein putative n=1 Tax=Albugo laibachii Nc14 TaxID=890382 RepID=F0WRK3_9STRA|nr:transmembrane protein putative [Albugo laibachii Nc14]|eukprot:CCA23966.1 transmembrane protein putative [Albugo laibachii Nc14]